MAEKGLKDHSTFLEAVAAHAMGSLISGLVFVAGTALISYAGAHLVPMLQASFYVFVMLVGLYVTGLGLFLTFRAWSRKPPAGLSSLAFRIMLEEFGFLLKVYRRLNFDDAEHTRYPLNYASWPNFQPPTEWTYTQISLHDLKGRFDWLVLIARRAFEEMGWTETVELFNLVPEVTVMVDLLPALESFTDLLRAKIATLEGAH